MEKYALIQAYFLETMANLFMHCSKCREHNPASSVLCQACYTPLHPSPDLIPLGQAACEENLVVSILDIILMHGVKEGATCVRLQIGVRCVSVFEEIDGQWHEHIRMPLYMWRHLREYLRIRSGAKQLVSSGEFVFRLCDARHRVVLSEDDTAIYLALTQP